MEPTICFYNFLLSKMFTRKERELFEAFSFTDFEGNLYKHIPNAYYVLNRDSGDWPGYSKNDKSISKKQFRDALAQNIRKWRKEKQDNMKIIYNGPHSEAARFFIKQIETRFERRPWTPSDEVSVMRAFAVTMDNFNIMVGKSILKNDNL